MNTFQFSQWGTMMPPDEWRIAVGQFTGSDRDDVVGYHPSNGSVWVQTNVGGTFEMSHWATVQPPDGWHLYAGLFTNPQRSDILVYHPSTGTLEVGRNTGSAFEFEQWGFVVPAEGWSFAVGHFLGGPTADIVGYHPLTGIVEVGVNTGNGFVFEEWGSVAPADGWTIRAGDFTGNGRTDVMGYHPSNGTVEVGRNLGNSFEFSQWARLDPPADWSLAPGRVLSRGLFDVVAYHPSDGRVWVLENTGESFTPQPWSSVEPATGWTFMPGRFTADELTDVVGYQSDDGRLSVGQFRYLGVEGYCWPLSGEPGQSIDFHLSSEGTVDITYSRHIADRDGVRSEPVGSGQSQPGVHIVPVRSWRDGCGWPVSFAKTVPATWRSGFYSATCTNVFGATSEVTFIVKPPPGGRSKLAVLANANTWHAYNGWGGSSKYAGRSLVSFLRPCPGSSPVGVGFEAMHLARAELWIIGWLSDAGYRADVYTDIDFHNSGLDPSVYRCLVVGTHPEYWTTGMYDQLQAYLDGGGSLLYLGGNGIFEVGTYVNAQKQMVFLDGIEFGPRGPALFRQAKPEQELLGVTTERCAAEGKPFQVQMADHPLFDGTGVANGDLFGTEGLNTGFGNGMASAWEVDCVDGPGVRGLPVNCGMGDGDSPPAVIPAGLDIIAQGLPEPAGQGADMTFYRHPGGGIVFSASSLTFGGSLVVDPVIQQIMRNALAQSGVSPG